jgi:Rubisco LSMT substrate-binding/SET domain
VHCLRSRCFAGELETAPFKERIKLFGLIGFLAISSSLFGILAPADAANGALTSVVALGMYDILTPRILRSMQGLQLKRYALIPGIDFMNHSSRMNGKAEVSYEYFTDKFVVRCGEDYAAGDQVFISYGAQSNDAFLQYYGFVERGNPADEYAFDEEYESVMKVTRGTLRAKRDVGFDESVIKEVASSFGGDLKAARNALTMLCRAELSSFATSLTDDLAIKAQSVQARLAVSYRVEKKRILMSAIERMELVASKAV